MIEDFKKVIMADFSRYGLIKYSILQLTNFFLFAKIPGMKFILNLRLLQHYRKKFKPLAYLFYRRHQRLKIKYGFDISYRTQIGEGFYIGHFGGVVIHGDTIIGKNCNVSQGVTIGISNHGKNAGTPVIGDNVFIGPGAVIVGNIKIGNNVTIGANSFVNFDVPDCKTVVTSNSIIIDKDLSNTYIQNRI